MTIPDKLSDAVELALTELERLENDPNYEICMGHWHNAAKDAGKCYACLAGAIISTGFAPEDPRPTHMKTYIMGQAGNEYLDRKLHAIDAIRAGHPIMAVISWRQSDHTWDWSTPTGLPVKISIPNYEDDPVLFKAAIRGTVDMLRSLNL